MDIFEFAMEREKIAESNYRQLAQKTQNSGLRNIMTMLADEEVKHYELIFAVSRATLLEASETTVLSDAKEILSKMKSGVDKLDFRDDELALYEKALQFEEKSRKYYAEKAAEVTDAHQKAVLEWLVGEEQKHYALVQSIISFVTEPQRWIDNAEWSHIEEY